MQKFQFLFRTYWLDSPGFLKEVSRMLEVCLCVVIFKTCFFNAQSHFTLTALHKHFLCHTPGLTHATPQLHLRRDRPMFADRLQAEWRSIQRWVVSLMALVLSVLVHYVPTYSSLGYIENLCDTRLVITGCLAVGLRLWQPWHIFRTSLSWTDVALEWTDVAWYSRFLTIGVNSQFRYFPGLQQPWLLAWSTHATTHTDCQMITGKKNKLSMQHWI